MPAQDINEYGNGAKPVVAGEEKYSELPKKAKLSLDKPLADWKKTDRDNFLEQFYGKRIKVDEETKKRMMMHFSQLAEEAIQRNTTAKTLLAQRINLYEGKPPEREGPWTGSANVVSGLSADIADTVQEYITDTLTRVSPQLSFVGLTAKAQQYQSVMEKYWDYQMNVCLDSFTLMDSIARGAVLEGCRTVIATTEPEEECSYRMDKDGPKKDTKIRRKHKAMCLKWEQVLLPDNASHNRKDLEFFGYYVYQSNDRLRDFAIDRGYDNTERLLRKPKDVKEPDESRTPMGTGAIPTDEEAEAARRDAEGLNQPEEPSHQIVTMFGYWRFKPGEKRKRVIFIFDRTTGVYMECRYFPIFMPEIPAHRFVIHERDGRWNGRSTLELTEQGEYEVNAIENQMLDNAAIANKVISYVDDGFDPNQYKIFPGATIKQLQKGNVEVLPLGELDFGGIALARGIKDDVRARTGITGATSGSQDSSDPRASGRKTQALLGRSDNRMIFYARRINRSMVGMIKDWNIQQAIMGEDETEYQQWNPEGGPDKQGAFETKTIPREAFEQEYVITMNGFTFAKNRQEELQQEMFLHEILAEEPIFTLPAEELQKLAPSQVRARYEGVKAILQKMGYQNLEKRLPLLSEILPIPKPEEPMPVPPPELQELLAGASNPTQTQGAPGAVPPPDEPPPQPPVAPEGAPPAVVTA